jgi:hypothetical protein
MEPVKWNYFQFRKTHQYPIYIRFKAEDVNTKYTHLLNELGFTLLTELETKKISLEKMNTRILTVQPASARIQQQINGSDLLDKYGMESLSVQLGTLVYTLRKVGLMGLPHGKTIWDLALHSEIIHTDKMVGLRIMLVRFLSQALSYEGVLSYWGTVKDDAIIAMKQSQSFGEAVFIDPSKKIIFSNGGEVKLPQHLKIIRKDKEMKALTNMTREDLIGFMSVSTCLLSFTGITNAMKKSILDLSLNASGSFAVTEASEINL